MTTIVLNGEEKTVDQGLTLDGLLKNLALDPGLVVVEVNRQIIPKARFAQTPCQDQDQIEIAHFMGGG